VFDPRSKPDSGWRREVYEVVFETEKRAGRIFDFALLVLIAVSGVAVSVESVPGISESTREILVALEYGLTFLFTVEYVLRAVCVERPRRYVLSVFGIIDLLAVLPTYLMFFIPAAGSLSVVRVLRLLRIFRLFRLRHYVREGDALLRAMKASRYRITVFVVTVVIVVAILGAVIYVIEGPEHGYDSIPSSMYWAVVTLTTVGYGDISPQTPLGQAIASAVMLLGYGIIAVPTGIVTAQIVQGERAHLGVPLVSKRCPACAAEEPRLDSRFCRQCGAGFAKDPE
jgi:voltage-gated potassium channel